jgi:hypothetical protein
VPDTEPSTEPSGGDSCVVCADPVVEDASALCNNCGKRFHLILTNDGVGKDCGDVWLNEDFMALEFGCRNCLAPDGAKTDADNVGADNAGADNAGEIDTAPTAPTMRTKHINTTARDVVRRKHR